MPSEENWSRAQGFSQSSLCPLVEREREQIAKSCIVLNIVLDGQGESGEISRWNRIHGVGRMDIDPGIDIKFAPKYLGGGGDLRSPTIPLVTVRLRVVSNSQSTLCVCQLHCLPHKPSYESALIPNRASS